MKCSFCGNVLQRGSGKMFVKTDGTVFYFCNSKCERNHMLGRESKKIKWARKK